MIVLHPADQQRNVGGCLRFIQAAIHAAILVTCIKSYTETQASPRPVIQYCGGERDSSWRSLNITFRSTSSRGTRSMWLFLAIFLLLFIKYKSHMQSIKGINQVLRWQARFLDKSIVIVLAREDAWDAHHLLHGQA